MKAVSRRLFFRSAALFPGVSLLAQYHAIAAPEKGKTRIRDIQVMILQGPRTYTLVKVESDAGLYGIGEAYGSPGVGVKEGIMALKPEFLGKDPLGIDVLITGLGWRTDGSAHSLMRAVSGIEMALWDLAGKTLGVPTTTLLGGRFRERVRMYDHSAPDDMMSPASCREWAQRVKADPSGFTAHKFGFPHTDPRSDRARDPSNRVLTATELSRIRKGFENCREALGWDHDILVHCHWEYDLRTSIQLAEAIEPIRPLWLEDPLPAHYAESWRRLVASSKVPICTGRERHPQAGIQGFRHQPRLRHPPSGSAEHGWFPRDQAGRRPGGVVLPAHGDPQHGQHGAHGGDGPLGQHDPRLPGLRDRRGPRRLDGRCGRSTTDRSFSRARSSFRIGPGSGWN